MRRHELLDYCDASDRGHYKWYPKGVLVRRLILDYAAAVARDWGAFEMVNPVLIRGDHNAVGELMGEFHERDYRVDGGRGIGYLRYASDPLAFPFMQNVRFSYRQAPLKVYEEASCFRNEQEGEVSGLKRVRSFTMTDMHAACASADQAREEFDRLCDLFARLMDDVIAPGRWVLGWEGTVAFFEANRDWLVSIGARLGVPALFKLSKDMTHYYAIKNEYQAITADGSNVQISTVQWDLKDGPRFDIGFYDDTGRKSPCPVILHASSFGSIERALCAMLESIAVDEAAGRPPAFPLWLAPAQVRVLPVSDAHLPAADALSGRLLSGGIRCEVDDRDFSVGRKIREGERDWVPYLVVFGDREANTGSLSVRVRGGSPPQATLEEAGLVSRIREAVAGMPWRPLSLPHRLARRPVFFG
jgi:threonyl-tRNA synthetase